MRLDKLPMTRAMTNAVAIWLAIVVCEPAAFAQETQKHALRFSGKSYVEITDSVKLVDLNNDFTVELWFNWKAGVNRDQYFLTDEVWPDMHPKLQAPHQIGWCLRALPRDQHVLLHFTAAQRNDWLVVESPARQLRTGWHHLAVNRRGKDLTLFLDGKEQAKRSSGDPFFNSHTNLYIGARKHAYKDRFLDCDVASVRLSRTARYQSDFQPRFVLKTDPSTLVLYRFGERTGTTTKNSASTKHEGRLSAPHAPTRLVLPRPVQFAATAAAGVSQKRTADKLHVVDETSCWAIEQESGRLFAGSATTSHVTEFSSSSGDAVRKYEVGGPPCRLIVTHGKLVVGTRKGTIAIVNLTTNKVESELKLGGKPLRFVAPDGARAVYLLSLSDDGDRQFCRLDMKTAKVDKRVNLQNREIDFAMQGNGRRVLFIDQYGSARLNDFDDRSFALKEVDHVRGSGMQVHQVPTCQNWVVGRSLYNLDFSRPKDDGDGPIRQLAGDLAAFHPAADLAASIQYDRNSAKLVIESYRASRVLHTLALEPKSDFSHGRRRTFDPMPQVLFDGRNQRLLVAYKKNTRLVDLKSLGVSLKPIVQIFPPGEHTLASDEPLGFRLRLTNPDLPVTFSRSEGPKGLTVDRQGNVSWRPSVADVGTHQVKVRATSNGDTSDATLAVRVTRPTIDVGFVVRRIEVDRAGHRAIVLGVLPSESDQLSKRLALVDLKTANVVATREMSKAVHEIAINDANVFLSPHESNVVHSLKLTDLSNHKRAFVDSSVESFSVISKGRLAVLTEGGLRSLSSKELTPVAVPGVKNRPNAGDRDNYPLGFAFRRRPRPRAAIPVNGGDLVGSVVFSDNDEAARLILPRPNQFTDVTFARDDRGSGPQDLLRDEPNWVPMLWNRQVSREGLFSDSAEAILRWKEYPSAAVILREYAIVAAAGFQAPNKSTQARLRKLGSRERRSQLVLELRELVEGAARETILLNDRPWASQLEHSRFGDSSRLAIGAAAGRVVVGWGSQLYLVPVPAKHAKHRTPVYFLPRQEPLTAKVGGKVQVKVKAVGGTGKIRYSLPHGIKGISLDAESGTLEFDTDLFWSRVAVYARERADWMGNDEAEQFRARQLGIADPKDLLGLPVENHAYELMFGKKTEDIPVSVRFRVGATDEQGLSARFASQLILLGSRKAYDQMVAKAAVEVKAERARHEAERKKRQAELAARKAAAAGGNNGELIQLLRRSIDRERELAKQVAATDARSMKLSGELRNMQKSLRELRDAPPRARNETGADAEQQLARLEQKLTAIESGMSDQRQRSQVALMIGIVAGCLCLGMVAMMLIIRRRAA